MHLYPGPINIAAANINTYATMPHFIRGANSFIVSTIFLFRPGSAISFLVDKLVSFIHNAFSASEAAGSVVITPYVTHP